MLQQDFTSKRTFSVKDRCALQLSYATLVTYKLVFGARQFQFLCRVIFDSSGQTDLNLFFLILQTPKPSTKKKEILLLSPRFVHIFFLLLNYCDNGFLTEGHMEAAISISYRGHPVRFKKTSAAPFCSRSPSCEEPGSAHEQTCKISREVDTCVEWGWPDTLRTIHVA